jgi:hypothetical protein
MVPPIHDNPENMCLILVVLNSIEFEKDTHSTCFFSGTALFIYTFLLIFMIFYLDQLLCALRVYFPLIEIQRAKNVLSLSKHLLTLDLNSAILAKATLLTPPLNHGLKSI